MEKFAFSSFFLFQDLYLQMLFMASSITILAVFARTRPTMLSFVILSLPILILLTQFTTTGNPSYWQWVNYVSPVFCCLLLIDGFILSPFKHRIHNNIEVHRHVAEKLSIGRPEEVTLHLINKSNQSLQGILWENPPQAMLSPASEQMQQTAFHLQPHHSKRFPFKIIPDQRGVFHFGKIDLHIKSRLGLLWQTCAIGRESKVQVYPDLKRIDEIRVRFTKSVTAGEVQKKRLGIEGLRFKSLKQYSSGDDFKKIDWQATARIGVPVTRTYSLEAEQPIYIMWEAGRKMQSLRKKTDPFSDKAIYLSQFDWALNAGLAFAAVATSRGDNVGGCVFHQEIIQELPAKKGKLLRMMGLKVKCRLLHLF